jgi:hypothetical protein
VPACPARRNALLRLDHEDERRALVVRVVFEVALVVVQGTFSGLGPRTCSLNGHLASGGQSHGGSSHVPQPLQK